MHLFQIGEIVIAQGHVGQPQYNGTEVEIIGSPLWCKAISLDTKRIFPMDFRYPIRWPDGKETWQPYWMLRKKYIPPDFQKLARELEKVA